MIKKLSFTIFCAFIFSQIIAAQSVPSTVIDYDTSDINGSVNVQAPGVLANDTDINGATLTVTEFSISNVTYNPGETANFTQGSIVINMDGSYIFTPNTGYTGDVNTITYTASNGNATATSTLNFTVEETTNLLEFNLFESCNQGYTVDETYKIRYTARINNKSNAKDYHESSIVNNIDLINNLDAIYGTGCVSSIEIISASTSIVTDYINDPYPTNFNEDLINPSFLDGTSSSVFSNTDTSLFSLYPRQTISLDFCVTIDAFCGGRTNPTVSGSGIDFNSILEINSSTDNVSQTLLLTDFHSNEAIVAAALYVPDEGTPESNLDGTFDYINTVIITNEGTAIATNVNYNMGLGNFIDNGISFSQLIVTQKSTLPITVNPSFDGTNSSKLLTSGNSLAPGETIILEVFALTDPVSSSNSHTFSQMSRSQTQGILDGFDENTRTYSYISWSDNSGNHLDRYYSATSETSAVSSTSNCSCESLSMRFSFTSSSSCTKTSTPINEIPNGILEHEEIEFQITVTNTSATVEIENLQIEDNLNNICSGNIISITPPIIDSSTTASTLPTLNTSYNGTSDTNIFDGNTGVLEPDQTITVTFTVLFYEDCIGNNIASFTAIDPLNNSANSSDTLPVNASTDTDNDGIPNGTDIDDDNDTILDTDEYSNNIALDDHDNDFIPNYRDTDFSTDANNDGIIDVFDLDNDGVPNHFDLDSDNDGIFDLIEVNNGSTSSDDDGIAATDNVGANGLHNDVEFNDSVNTNINYTIPNSDNNGNPNFIDIDSDGDGIVDNIEAQATFNYTLPNNTFTNTGIDTAYPEGLTPIDTEDDSTPDYVDTNSDNDIREDVIEGWDLESDGIAETIAIGSDADGDGLDDAFDNDDTILNPTNGQLPTDFPDVDNTDDPEKDWRERMAIVLLIDDVSVNEDTSLLTFTILLVTKTHDDIAVQSNTDIAISFTNMDGTEDSSEHEIAYAPYDYTELTTGTNILTIPAGDDIAQFSITIIDDNIFEKDESFTLNGIVTSNNTFTTEISGVGTIVDNEPLPTIILNDSSENEGADLEHILQISHPSSTPIVIDVETFSNTAIAPSDYTDTSETLTINGTIDPNNANTEVSLLITTLTDNTNELEEETLNVTGTVKTLNIDPTTRALTAIGTIVDIDPNPLVSVNDDSTTEGNTLQYTFSLLNNDNEPMLNYLPIVLNITTADYTATEALDYNAINTNITIPALTSSTSKVISTIDDNLNEETETFSLITTFNTNQVSNNTSDLVNTGEIKDDDIPNLFSPNNDGNSDLFKIAGMQDYPNFKLVIFDRWGSEVYNYSNNGNTSPEWWNGSYEGKEAPKGVYFYKLDYNDGATQPKKNFIELIR